LISDSEKLRKCFRTMHYLIQELIFENFLIKNDVNLNYTLMHQNICCYIFCSLFNTWKIELLSNKNKNIWVFYWFNCDIDSEKIIVSDFDSDSNPETFCATPIPTPQFTRINIWWTNEWMYERKYPFSLYIVVVFKILFTPLKESLIHWMRRIIDELYTSLNIVCSDHSEPYTCTV
jgi:hypothetical protein